MSPADCSAPPPGAQQASQPSHTHSRDRNHLCPWSCLGQNTWCHSGLCLFSHMPPLVHWRVLLALSPPPSRPLLTPPFLPQVWATILPRLMTRVPFSGPAPTSPGTAAEPPVNAAPLASLRVRATIRSCGVWQALCVAPSHPIPSALPAPWGQGPQPLFRPTTTSCLSAWASPSAPPRLPQMSLWGLPLLKSCTHI